MTYIGSLKSLAPSPGPTAHDVTGVFHVCSWRRAGEPLACAGLRARGEAPPSPPWSARRSSRAGSSPLTRTSASTGTFGNIPGKRWRPADGVCSDVADGGIIYI